MRAMLPVVAAGALAAGAAGAQSTSTTTSPPTSPTTAPTQEFGPGSSRLMQSTTPAPGPASNPPTIPNPTTTTAPSATTGVTCVPDTRVNPPLTGQTTTGSATSREGAATPPRGGAAVQAVCPPGQKPQ